MVSEFLPFFEVQFHVLRSENKSRNILPFRCVGADDFVRLQVLFCARVLRLFSLLVICIATPFLLFVNKIL